MAKGKGNSTDDGKNGDDRKKNGKNGFDGNTPKLVVLQLHFLGTLESVKLTKGEKITMIFGAGVDGDIVGDDSVGDTRHCFLTNWTSNRWTVLIRIFWRNGVEVLGGDLRNEIGDEGRNEVTSAVETLVD